MRLDLFKGGDRTISPRCKVARCRSSARTSLGIMVWSLVLGAAVLPTRGRAATWAHPGPGACATLQGCIDAAAPGDVVEIVTAGPIAESPSFGKALTLRAGPGFDPVIGDNHFLSVVYNGATEARVVIQGLTFERGAILVTNNSGGTLWVHVLHNVVEEPRNNNGVVVTSSTGAGPVRYEVAWNTIHLPSRAFGPTGVAVTNGGDDSRGVVHHNRIVSSGDNAIGIQAVNGSGELWLHASNNRITGTGMRSGIAVFQSGAGSTLARLTGNLVRGQSGSGDFDGGLLLSAACDFLSGACGGELTAEVANNTVVRGRKGVVLRGEAGMDLLGEVANNAIAEHSQVGLFVDPAFSAAVGNRHNLLFENAATVFVPGPGTVTADPLFVGLEDFRLAPGSPAVDVGDDTAAVSNFVADLDGRPRFAGSAVDLGAFELPGSGDAFGYQLASTGPHCRYGFVGVSGTPAVSGDEAASSPIDLPFTFDLYGFPIDRLVMSTNGYLSSDPSDSGADDTNDCPLPALPQGGFGPRIYALHDDLFLADGRHQHFGSCPRPADVGGDRPCSVFEWRGVEHVGSDELFDFQVILYQGTHQIVVQTRGANPEAGGGSTTAIQSATVIPLELTRSSTYACNEISMPGDHAVCFFHPAAGQPEVPIFFDGFELGDTSRWSAESP